MKRLISIFVFILFASFVWVSHASAQTPTYTTPQQLPINTTSDVPQNMNTYTQSVFINILATASCFTTGFDPLTTDGKCLEVDPLTKKLGYAKEGQGGLLAVASGLIGSTYNIPVSSVEYGKNIAANFGITRNTYAQTAEEICADLPPESQGQCLNERQSQGSGGFGQGIGFKGLTPVLQIWETFRNIVYLLFVLVFILLGLGIMFRVNIDARTVMTIQNQIPKIVVALILITLSYAIAGFLIDMMYVTIYVVIQLFHSQGLTTITNIDTNPINAVGSLGGIADIAGPIAQDIGGMISSLFDGTLGTIVSTMVSTIVGALIGTGFTGGIPGVGTLIGGILGGVIGVFAGNQIIGLIASVIAYLIIVIALLSVLFRVWFMLIKAYVFIILDVIFAPFWLLSGVIPGAGGGFGPWIRSLASNLAAFPVVIILFLIGKAVQENIVPGQQTFIPPLVGNPGDNAVSTIGSIIGLGMILIMPEAVSITKQAFKAPDLKVTGAAGKAIGVGQGVLEKPLSSTWNELTRERRDGTRGPLRSTAEDLGKRIADKTGLSNTPFGKMWSAYRRREQEHLSEMYERRAAAYKPSPSGDAGAGVGDDATARHEGETTEGGPRVG